jgi:hypothetical protein
MNRTAINFLAALALLLALITVTAQEKGKAWSDWSKKDAEKMLNDSPWAKTQTDTDTSQMFYSPTKEAGTGSMTQSQSVNNDRSITGATNQSVSTKFHVRFYSARPIRQALARVMELQQKLAPDIAERLKSFAELKSTNSIIVTVTFESTDQRYSGTAMQAFNSAITATMKNNTYLERSDGKHLFLEEYVPPGKDGFGARFIFLRELDGQLFITKDTGEVRFYAQYSNGIKIDRRFKVADMLYDGELEY